MRVRLFVVFALAAAMPLTAASAMPVSTFLDKANRLEKKGPAALFSSDLKLLTRAQGLLHACRRREAQQPRHLGSDERRSAGAARVDADQGRDAQLLRPPLPLQRLRA
jgi:hypothetical protein